MMFSAVGADTVYDLLKELNNHNLNKEDIVSIVYNNKQYIAIFIIK